jgi:L-asparaginase
MKKIVHVLCTGGTFDKVYGSGSGVSDFSFPEKTAVLDIATRLGIRSLQVSYELAKAKDSLDMTDHDRSTIAAWCARPHHECCVVIHGTDTMIKTASVIADRSLSNVIVLTGALQPACMRNTDAEFNLGGALIAAQISSPGVYIVMSGTIYLWDKCRKNPITGQFEPI